jgi:hypothetical protein
MNDDVREMYNNNIKYGGCCRKCFAANRIANISAGNVPLQTGLRTFMPETEIKIEFFTVINRSP